MLLLRQLYLAHVELGRLEQAEASARQMIGVGAMADVALHDLARVLVGQGRWAEAARAQRLAARRSPPGRRSFHLWNLGTWLHFGGEVELALGALDRATRWARDDRALVDAHAAYVALDAGRAVPALGAVVARLQGAKNREGYGQFLLAMLAHLMGDTRRAAVHARAFLTRNAAADAVKAMTLREELRRARTVLASIESA